MNDWSGYRRGYPLPPPPFPGGGPGMSNRGWPPLPPGAPPVIQGPPPGAYSLSAPPPPNFSMPGIHPRRRWNGPPIYW